MQNLDINKTAAAWAPLSRTLFVPHTESEYRQLVGLLDIAAFGILSRRRVAKLPVPEHSASKLVGKFAFRIMLLDEIQELYKMMLMQSQQILFGKSFIELSWMRP